LPNSAIAPPGAIAHVCGIRFARVVQPREDSSMDASND
jgi:hypothetical protein